MSIAVSVIIYRFRCNDYICNPAFGCLIDSVFKALPDKLFVLYQGSIPKKKMSPQRYTQKSFEHVTLKKLIFEKNVTSN